MYNEVSYGGVFMAEFKTNVMRFLEQKKIKYSAHEYPHGDAPVDGLTVASITGTDPTKVYKTLVTRGASKKIYVFVIPVCMELVLKKAAKAVGEKSISMIAVSEINALTGYVRGGCSPVGMKKQYVTVYHSDILLLDTVMVSAGKIGYQIELNPLDLIKLTNGKTADVAAEE